MTVEPRRGEELENEVVLRLEKNWDWKKRLLGRLFTAIARMEEWQEMPTAS